MKHIEDLSYSNLVNIIQKQEKVGADVLDCIADEKEMLEKEIEKLEQGLMLKKSRVNILKGASKSILKHLDKNLPLIVRRDDYVIHVTGSDLIIDRNVI